MFLNLNKERTIGLQEIADALRSPAATIINDGPYHNRKGHPGYYVEVRSGHLWCKISVSNTAIREDLGVIADDLSSPNAFIEKGGYYQNRSGVFGYQATVRYETRWYMVSVSSVDSLRYLNLEAA